MSQKSLLTVSFIARHALVYAIDKKWPFNACECCYFWPEMQIRLRFFGEGMLRKYDGQKKYACAYDKHAGYSDGSEQEVHLDPLVQQYSLNDLYALIETTIAPPWGLIESPARQCG